MKLDRYKFERIDCIKKNLELYGYKKSREMIEDGWHLVFYPNIPITLGDRNSEAVMNSGMYYDFAILDMLYYQGVSLNIYKRFRKIIKDKVYHFYCNINHKKGREDIKNDLSSFLQSMGNHTLKYRKIYFKER